MIDNTFESLFLLPKIDKLMILNLIQNLNKSLYIQLYQDLLTRFWFSLLQSEILICKWSWSTRGYIFYSWHEYLLCICHTIERLKWLLLIVMSGFHWREGDINPSTKTSMQNLLTRYTGIKMEQSLREWLTNDWPNLRPIL